MSTPEMTPMEQPEVAAAQRHDEAVASPQQDGPQTPAAEPGAEQPAEAPQGESVSGDERPEPVIARVDLPPGATPWPNLPIVVGVDGSADGLRAVAFAVRVAAPMGLRLHLVHSVDDAVLAGAWGVVYDPTSLQQVGKDVVQQAAQHAEQLGMPRELIDAEVVLGNAAAVLSALSEQASLVVIGRRAVGGLERMFVGSTSVSVAATAKCPVIVISAAANPHPTGDLGVIGVGVEFTRGSPKPLEFAFEEASRRGARVLVHTVQSHVPSGMQGGYRLTDTANDEITRAAQAQLDELVKPFAERFPTVRFSCEVSLGHPVEQLLALSEQVDLMVLGMRPPKVLGFSIGGVTRAVLAHAKSLLAVVR